MNFKKIVSTIVLFSFCVPQIVLAQNAPSPDQDPPVKDISHVLPLSQLTQGETDPGFALSPMKKRQKAPFTGVLLSPSAVANIIVELETIEERIHIEIVKATQLEQANCDKKLADATAKARADVKVLQASIDSKNKTINVLNVELKTLNDYNNAEWHPTAWVGIGTATGILLTVLTAFAISKATQ